MDSLSAFATQLITISLYLDQGERMAASRKGFRGILERLYDAEKDPEVKRLCRDYLFGFHREATQPLRLETTPLKGSL